MLLRSLCWYAATRPRHTWMALMVKECSVMPLPSISSFVQATFSPKTTPKPKTRPSDANTDCTTQISSGTALSIPPPGKAPTERAHAWAAVARLLCESGDWARAAAVVDGLPSFLQQTERLKAIRNDWPLPRTITEAWLQGGRKEEERGKTATTAKALTAMPHPTNTTADYESKTAGLTSNPNSVSTINEEEEEWCGQSKPKKQHYALLRDEELMRIAYGLRRSPAPLSATSSSSPSMSLPKEQRAIVTELLRRGAVAEVLQCIVNWHHRQLLRPDAESMREFSSTDMKKRHNDDFALFDGLGAAKSILFPGETLTPVSGAVSAFTTDTNGIRSGEPPCYSPKQLSHIYQAAIAHPLLVARCFRDRAVCDRLLRHAGDAKVADFVFQYLQAISTSATPATHKIGLPSPSSSPLLTDLSALETYWRALATLLPLLHPYWRQQPKVDKERLIQALNAALKTTKVNAGERSSSFSCGLPPQAELSDKCRRAIKASVESVCSPLLHHEPQVRFLRLSTFRDIALTLTVLHVAIPNALMQCLFLCVADTGPTFSDTNSKSVASSTLRNTMDVSEAENSNQMLNAFLSAFPYDRWQPALAMLHAAHRRCDFRVTAAHERALLSGLQSVSITKTWQAALRVVGEFKTAFHVTPDERTLPTLLLNLKQQSWQNAFRVLEWVPGGEPSAASPLILRDLQLVALKYASWEMPLQLMTWLKERHADGFMNYLYCVCAASRGGQAVAAFRYFCSLQRGRGRHTAWRDVSPYNELTVAVAAVAMLDYRHFNALHSFVQHVLSMKAPATVDSAEGGDAATWDITPDGRFMTQAADIAALLGAQRHDELVQLLLGLPENAVQPVLRRFVVLRCLLGMGHLNAPIRLIFDVLGYGSSPQQRRTHQHFLSSVEAVQASEGTFETRQRNSIERRKHLFIPMAHQRCQKIAAATQLGAFMKAKESALPAYVVQQVAEVMVEEGVGTEYMTAALL